MSAIFLQGSAISVLQGLPDNFFHCTVTSPPYYGLRKYEGGKEVWEDGWYGQLGGEPTPDLYISHLIQIMRSVRRVLRPDGVFWINIGDSWASSKSQNGNSVKPLDMVLIPSLLALAARADGWFTRSMVVWDKRSPMPESVNGWRWEEHRVEKCRCGAFSSFRRRVCEVCGWQKPVTGNLQFVSLYVGCPGCPKCLPNDGYVLRRGSWRPTDSYEFVLMLTKTKSYFCDREAVREPVGFNAAGRCSVRPSGDSRVRDKEHWGVPHDLAQVTRVYERTCGPNRRSVWSFPTKPGKFNHYAAYPPRLPELAIKSSISERGCCSRCGSPWARVIERGFAGHDGDTSSGYPVGTTANRLALLRQAAREGGAEYANTTRTSGWRPTCSCAAGEPIPCRVLDPFSGAGTTALVAERLGLDSVSIDTSEEYIQLSKDRLADDEQKRIAEFIKKAKSAARNNTRKST